MANVPSELIYSGPNAQLVNEIIEFAFGPNILSANGADEELDDVVIISDMVRAVDLAGGTEAWCNLRENFVLKLIQTTEYWEWKSEHESALHTCKSLAVKWRADSPMYLHDSLRTILPEGPVGPDGAKGYYRDYIINEVASDLMECCKNRAFNGKVDNFWERLFAVYQTGLWPCGWRGRRDKAGKFIAWRRAS